MANIYIALWRPKTQRCSEDRELDQARSKPNTVNRPVRNAHTFVHLYNRTQYYNIETVFSIFPFLQTNITSQMWPSGGKGGGTSFENIIGQTKRAAIVCVSVKITSSVIRHSPESSISEYHLHILKSVAEEILCRVQDQVTDCCSRLQFMHKCTNIIS